MGLLILTRFLRFGMLRDMLRFLIAFAVALPVLAGDLQVGVGRIKITPERPISYPATRRGRSRRRA